MFKVLAILMVSHKELADQKDRSIYGRELAPSDWLIRFVFECLRQARPSLESIRLFLLLAIVHSLGLIHSKCFRSIGELSSVIMNVYDGAGPQR